MSALLGQLLPATPAAIAAQNVVYGMPPLVAAPIYPANWKTCGQVRAEVLQLIGALPLVRWPDKSVVIARPVIKAVRMIGAMYPTATESARNSKILFRGAYMIFVHVQAGAAYKSPAWSWPEQVIMLADYRQLRGQSDSRFVMAAASELIASWLEAGILANGTPVLLDAVRSAAIKPVVKRRYVRVQARVAAERERVALAALTKANAATGLAGAALAKKNDDAPTLAKWQAAALLQKNYYTSLVSGWT